MALSRHPTVGALSASHIRLSLDPHRRWRSLGLPQIHYKIVPHFYNHSDSFLSSTSFPFTMGKSPAKWVKNILRGKKSSKPYPSKKSADENNAPAHLQESSKEPSEHTRF